MIKWSYNLKINNKMRCLDGNTSTIIKSEWNYIIFIHIGIHLITKMHLKLLTSRVDLDKRKISWCPYKIYWINKLNWKKTNENSIKSTWILEIILARFKIFNEIFFILFLVSCLILQIKGDVWHYPNEEKNGQLAGKQSHAVFC